MTPWFYEVEREDGSVAWRKIKPTKRDPTGAKRAAGYVAYAQPCPTTGKWLPRVRLGSKRSK